MSVNVSNVYICVLTSKASYVYGQNWHTYSIPDVDHLSVLLEMRWAFHEKSKNIQQVRASSQYPIYFLGFSRVIYVHHSYPVLPWGGLWRVDSCSSNLLSISVSRYFIVLGGTDRDLATKFYVLWALVAGV